MKKSIFLAAAMVIATALTGCEKKSAGSMKPIKEITSDVINCGVEFPEMIEVEEDYFQIKYNLTADDYETYSLWWAGSGAEADEVCIIKAKDTAKVKGAVEERIESQKTAFKDYVPDQYEKLCGAEVKTNGDYVYWLCTNDNDKTKKIVEDNFK